MTKARRSFTFALLLTDCGAQFRVIQASEVMAKSDITGKRKVRAQNVSHSNIKTKRWQNVNIQTRRVWVPEAGRFVTLNLTTRDIRTIDKIGVVAYAKRHGVSLV
ncbi:MAG TPA: 50S ribosomal protein L28 [Polyangiaceae bacterium]|nr:50S ribosomal protein L28 [Polyangiaceae bacterium]